MQRCLLIFISTFSCAVFAQWAGVKWADFLPLIMVTIGGGSSVWYSVVGFIKTWTAPSLTIMGLPNVVQESVRYLGFDRF